MWQDNGRMKCEEATGLLDRLADGELENGKRSIVEAHVDQCPNCGRQLASIRQWKSRLKVTVEGQVVPPGLAVRVRARLEEPARRGFWVPQWAMVAAVLVLAVGTWSAMDVAGMRGRALAMLAIGAGDHIHCVLERKGNAWQADLGPMGAGYGGLLGAVQTQMPAGYQFIQSHICNHKKRKFAHIVYEKDGKFLSLIVTRKEADEAFPARAIVAKMKAEGIPIYETHVEGQEALGFDLPGDMAFLVGDVGDQEQRTLVAALAPAVKRVFANGS